MGLAKELIEEIDSVDIKRPISSIDVDEVSREEADAYVKGRVDVELLKDSGLYDEWSGLEDKRLEIESLVDAEDDSDKVAGYEGQMADIDKKMSGLVEDARARVHASYLKWVKEQIREDPESFIEV